MTLEEKIRRLPPKKKEIVEKIVDALLEADEKKKPKFEWIGALKGIGRDGVYWQHKITEWRGEKHAD